MLLIFETNNPADTWDGKFKSETVNLDVYVYYIDARILTCGQAVKEIIKKRSYYYFAVKIKSSLDIFIFITQCF